MTKSILDTSWMLSLDKGTRRSYQFTANETAQALVSVFKNYSGTLPVGAKFGEIMVSMSSTRSLAVLFDHKVVPIAELWKPQKKQNEGFDFHTECPMNLINFGEAKYSGVVNPHGNAITQEDGFIKVQKHLRDRVHLTNLTNQLSVYNLDDEKFGVVAAFSINSKNLASIMDNALKNIGSSDLMNNAQVVYLVGVVC
ncbi:hypothetical protein [Pseudocolwellia sp. HL-MZ7]|uniref:hypothetical protein n=1 Tax=Pseudocolwellia sp. HL-MZ7 TaxID=3400627 RepID=UPI003CE88169